MNVNEIIDNKELREELSGRINVLEKVKNVLLIPETEYATTALVADYYEVNIEAVQKIVIRNRDELQEDGLKMLKGKEIMDNLGVDMLSIPRDRGCYKVDNIKIWYGNNTLFPRRAILRVGMLLRDSAVAREVRTQLLNGEEKTPADIKTADINEEQHLLLNVVVALTSGDTQEAMRAFSEVLTFKDRHITKLETTNKALSNSILEWEDRSRLNFAVRKLAGISGQPYATMWNELYKQLRNKYHIDLKRRGKRPYISTVRKEEWG